MNKHFQKNDYKEEDKTTYIFGKNAVLEAVRNSPHSLEKIYIEKDKNIDDEKIIEIQTLARKNKVQLEVNEYIQIPNQIRKENFQGVGAVVDTNKLLIDLKSFITSLSKDISHSVIVLGELEDVQNVGSIIRSAAALGASGVLVPEHRQADINGTVIKISSGTAFSIPLVRIGNVNTSLEVLKKEGFWIYGLDETAEKFIYEEEFPDRTAFVVGNEGSGLRMKTSENCDILLKIPQSVKIESQNAATSSAITLYEWRRQKPF